MKAPRYPCENCGGDHAVPAELCAGGCMVVGNVVICPNCGTISLDPSRHDTGSLAREIFEIVDRVDQAYDRE